MKKLLFLFIISVFTTAVVSQTAVNFNANDCSSANHDLFSELNSGKVIVIAWVMPCANCISGALAGYTSVQNYAGSNPGQVKFYLADDVANTSCATLQSWANTNGMTNCDAVFSNTAVNMSAYGAAGMPKLIVVGGSNHAVYYNVNGSGAITSSDIQSAINSALSDVAAGIKEHSEFISAANIYPNPSNTSVNFSLNLIKRANVKIHIQNQLGQKISEVYNGSLQQGENMFNINTTAFNNGTYFINCTVEESSKILKLVIVR
ncbi:MAG: hypothetical protein JWO32_1163 [Bacteroidetes bacterium]|nr:hypothetical protein [Bacteroidota bacterium]